MDNQCIIQFFEWNLPPDALLWQRAEAQARNLRNLGFDIIWLPPAYKGARGVRDAGYGVYDLYDLGEFDQKGGVPTKYGTREEYLKAIKSLQKAGLSVLVDIVLNHRMGADETEKVQAVKDNPENREQEVGGERQIEAWTKYTFPGRKGKYSDFVWDWTCFTGIDWDEKKEEGGVFQFEGKDWSEEVAEEKGNFDYLMGADVDMNNEKVVKELVRWGKWYLDTTGADGFRLDALKHIEYSFYEKWLDAARKKADEDLFAMGEYWSGDVEELLGYLDNCGRRMSLFDVALHMHFRDASQSGGGYGMQGLFADTLVERDTLHAVTFVDNHDTQPGQALESWVEEWFKPLAYAAILLRRDGLPCVFYADLYGLRSDGVPPVPGLRRMLAARKLCAYGEQHDYFDHEHVVGWTREGDKDHEHSGCAVLMTDKDAGEKTMYVGKQQAGQAFRDITRREWDPVVIGEDGNGTFKVPGGGVSVYVRPEMYREIGVNWE
ncbi:alpha-amylase [Ruminococcaceae bacterium OttesenSCG-928-I18]|nr:alpha-amylase [Ruminococcaceae bacterium OttesenSCG-928-I18]